jgi:hypothetical protein
LSMSTTYLYFNMNTIHIHCTGPRPVCRYIKLPAKYFRIVFMKNNMFSGVDCIMSEDVKSLFDVSSCLVTNSFGKLYQQVWSLAFADNLVIVAKSEREMRSLGKYVRGKKLEVNVEKTKMMVFNK